MPSTTPLYRRGVWAAAHFGGQRRRPTRGQQWLAQTNAPKIERTSHSLHPQETRNETALRTELAGPLGLAAGLEYREESFKDDRDPRLDGTVAFTDFQGDTFPFVSDVVNSSPTPDNKGSRDVVSLFAELQIPVLPNLDAQAAIRYESFSDVGDTTVGKFAAGWRLHEAILVRGSWSEAFRAPNLVTVNEDIVARQNTRNDYACIYAADFGGDPGQDVIDCRNSIQRVAQGSEDLKAERSSNFSVGVVLEPFDALTVTFDYWSIEKEDTIGLFGEENHTTLDLLQRLRHGAGNCGALAANPAVIRDNEVNPEVAAIYTAAGICPAGDIIRVSDRYANLDTRTLKGFDIGVLYQVESAWGNFRLRYNASLLDTFEQEAGGNSAVLVSAQETGELPASIPVTGFADLVQRNGNQKQKHNLTLAWRKGAFGAGLSGVKIGKIYQDSLTLNDGRRWWLDAMTTWNATFDYHWDMGSETCAFASACAISPTSARPWRIATSATSQTPIRTTGATSTWICA